MTLNQYTLNMSMLRNLREAFPAMKVDLKFDGYVMANERPLILIEQMQNNYEYITKQRESVETIYRYQIGLYDTNSIELAKNQERLMRKFHFDKFTSYNAFENPWTIAGSFMCELNGVTPITAGDITQKSSYNRVYFDVEIIDIKRRC